MNLPKTPEPRIEYGIYSIYSDGVTEDFELLPSAEVLERINITIGGYINKRIEGGRKMGWTCTVVSHAIIVGPWAETRIPD